PYFAGADATAAVINTNLATAVAMMTWIIMDMTWGKERRPTFLGGVNGLICGLLVGLLADPKMIVYLGIGKSPNVTTAGLFYGHPHQLLVQAGAALTVIVWDGLVAFL